MKVFPLPGAPAQDGGPTAGSIITVRRRAERCLEMRPTFHNPQARDVLLQMAHVWLRLADKCEYANEMVSRSKTAEAQPVVQQQQQIQPKKEDE